MKPPVASFLAPVRLSEQTGNIIRWTARSEMFSRFEELDTYHVFGTDNAGEPIGPLRILLYFDGGAQGSNRDLFFPPGPQTDGDQGGVPAILFTDNTGFLGATLFAYAPVVAPAQLTFIGLAVDRFNQIQDRIQGSGQPVSVPTMVTDLQGFQFSYLRTRDFVYGPENLTAVLAWDVNPGERGAAMVSQLTGLALSTLLGPCERSDEETCGRPAVKPTKDQFSCRTTGCAIPVTCKLTTPCKTKTKLLVTPESIRLKNGVKVQRSIKFATAVTNIPPGKTLTIRPKLTKQGKRLVRANRNRIIDGVMSIRNAATGDLFSSTPVRIRLK